MLSSRNLFFIHTDRLVTFSGTKAKCSPDVGAVEAAAVGASAAAAEVPRVANERSACDKIIKKDHKNDHFLDSNLELMIL